MKERTAICLEEYPAVRSGWIFRRSQHNEVKIAVRRLNLCPTVQPEWIEMTRLLPYVVGAVIRSRNVDPGYAVDFPDQLQAVPEVGTTPLV
jgi:hypothetical protein